MMNKLDYDVVIVGAGIVGLAFACSLIEKDLRLAIVDKRSDAWETNLDAQSALRVSVITQGSQQILEKLHVWQRLDRAALSPIRCMRVWEQASTSSLCFDAAEVIQPCLGTVVKNHDLQVALMAQAKTADNIDWFFSESLVAVRHRETPIQVVLRMGSELTTQLLVGADGAQSSVRTLAEILNREFAYQQHAIVATVQTELIHEQAAQQIFLSTGPLAFLPLADPYYSSIVWSTTPESAEELMRVSKQHFCLELADAFEQRLGNVLQTSPRLQFPLTQQTSGSYVKPGIALIGDAAHTVHPLAGQGANLGIADADCLARVILGAKQKQRKFGFWALHNLRPYERERRFHHQLMGGGIDLIKSVFEAKNPFLVTMRHLGLGLIDRTSCVKNYFMDYAMGNPRINLLVE